MQQTEKIHYLSLGAGVQSSTMALMAAKGEIDAPMPQFAVFADTLAEPQSVYIWLDWLEKQLPYPVYRIEKGSLENISTTVYTAKKSGNTYGRSAVPAFMIDSDRKVGVMIRQCTQDHKIKPILSFVRKKIGRKAFAVQWLGISTDEISRVRDSREKWKANYYPLINMAMSRYDCLKWMNLNGYPVPPRSACVFCPFRADREWKDLKENEPVEFQRAVEYELKYQETYSKINNFRGIPFLHNSLKPLSEVDFDPTRDQINLFNNDCGGHCGV